MNEHLDLPPLPPELRPHATLATKFPPVLRLMANLPWRCPSHQQQHHRANPTAIDDLRAWTIGTLPAHAARLLVGQWITTGMGEDEDLRDVKGGA